MNIINPGPRCNNLWSAITTRDIAIPLLGGCYGKSCKLNGQHTRARNHSAISRVVIALHKLLHRGPGLMIFITALSKRNLIIKHVKAPPTRDVAVYNPSALGRYAPSGVGIIQRISLDLEHPRGGTTRAPQ